MILKYVVKSGPKHKPVLLSQPRGTYWCYRTLAVTIRPFPKLTKFNANYHLPDDRSWFGEDFRLTCQGVLWYSSGLKSQRSEVQIPAAVGEFFNFKKMTWQAANCDNKFQRGKRLYWMATAFWHSFQRLACTGWSRFHDHTCIESSIGLIRFSGPETANRGV